MPLKTVDNALVKFLVYGWAVFLTTGGGLSFLGKLKGTWAGEVIGLPALVAANYVLSLILFFNGSSIGVIIFGGIFVGMGTAFIGRWVELYNLSRHHISLVGDQ